MNSQVSRPPQIDQHNEGEYEVFLSDIREHFAKAIDEDKVLFKTDASDLFITFVSALPNLRQHYICNACQKFVDRYGGLAAITPDGETVPVMWPVDVPVFYRKAVNAVNRAVSKARITGVFFDDRPVWGRPVTGEWHHMAVLPNGVVFDHPIQTPDQVMAEKREDYKTLLNGLARYPIEVVEQALLILKTDSLYRSEKVLGIAKWLKKVHKQRASTKNRRIINNLTWLAVATAPAGFCHIKSSMIGTLLEDIVDGLYVDAISRRFFDTITRRFADKMHPLQYQRPQVAPTAGNIAQAEKVIEKLKVAGSLERRFARIDELSLIWSPIEQHQEPIEVGEGVFSHLVPKGYRTVREIAIPAITMNWRKFQETVLPTAETIEFYVPQRRESYTALVTAVDYKAPPILQWDFEGQRNPVSWYLYNNESRPDDWGLIGGQYHRVTGICFKPSMWHGNFSHHGEGVIFILDGAKDTLYEDSGNALFPEILKTEFHNIRSTIEAYSKDATLKGADEASACGIALLKGNQWNVFFRVFADGTKIDYILDRIDISSHTRG